MLNFVLVGPVNNARDPRKNAQRSWNFFLALSKLTLNATRNASLYHIETTEINYKKYVLFLFYLSKHVSYYLYAIYYFCFTQRCLDKFCLICFRNIGCQSLLGINPLLVKFFKSLYYNRFYCIQQVNMSWVIYDFSHMFICLLWFCHELPNREIVRTYVIHLLGTYVTILCNWLILWQNALYIYLGRFRMCLILHEICCSSLVLKLWKLD